MSPRRRTTTSHQLRPEFVQLSPASTLDFARACSAAALAASKDDNLRMLTGVHMVTWDSTIRIEGSDSYRLHRVEVDLLDVDEQPVKLPPWVGVVPASFVKLLPSKARDISPAGLRLDLPHEADRFGWSHDGATFSIATIIDPDYVKAHGRVWVDSVGLLAAADRSEKPDLESARAFNPKYLADIYRAAEIVFPGEYAAAQVMHLEPMKPCRFDVSPLYRQHDSRLRMTALLMPVRIPPVTAQGAA